MKLRATRDLAGAAAATRPTMMALMLTLLGGGAGCNEISGAKDIDFARAPDAGGGDGTDGGGGGGSAGAGGGGAGGMDGGGGGVSYYNLSCGNGNVAVGIYGRSGAWLDQLGLICAPLQADGGALGATSMTSAVGGNGGKAGQATCPMNQAMVGIEILSDVNVVYQINLLCQTIAEWKMPNASKLSVPGLGNVTAQKTGLICPQGFVLNRVDGESSKYVLRAQFYCTKT